MEARDVALLGFVSAAQKYVDKHLNDGSNLGDLKNVNIRKLKDDLSSQLNLLSLSDEYKNGLVQVGEKAFNEYAKENLKEKHSVVDELGEIFKVDFEDFKTEPIKGEDDIDTLLNAYDLDEKVSLSSSINKSKNDDLDEFGLSSTDDILLTIANAAAKSDEELARSFEDISIKKPANMDSTYADVLDNENKDADEPLSLSQVLKEIGETIADDTGYFEEYEPEEFYKNQQKEEKKANDIGIVVNPALDIVLEREKEDAKNFYDITEENTVTTNPGLETNDQTLSEVLAGLGALKDKQTGVVTSTSSKDPNEEIYIQLMAAYPYLNKGFIKSAYEQKEEIEEDYQDGKDYILLHRLVFSDVDDLHEFVEIMMSHDYSVNVDEKQMIVDTFNEFTNNEGIILTNILSIANQAKILNGEYDGYRVFEKEGK